MEYPIACLPEELRVGFALFQKMAAPAQVTYQQFFNHLDIRFGSMPSSTAGAIWTDVRLEVEGKITPAKFTSFKVAFLSAMWDVKDATADEATCMLLSRLKPYLGLMTWINRAETKEGDFHPAFEVSFGMPPLSREMFLQEFQANTHLIPRTLESRPQGVWVVSLPHK